MTPVGFEPTQLALVELESTPLDHSGKVSLLAVGQNFAMGVVGPCKDERILERSRRNWPTAAAKSIEKESKTHSPRTQLDRLPP